MKASLEPWTWLQAHIHLLAWRTLFPSGNYRYEGL